MLDIILLAMGLGFFTVSVGYTIACDRPEESSMIFDYSLAALVTVGIMIYLVYALLEPGRF